MAALVAQGAAAWLAADVKERADGIAVAADQGDAAACATAGHVLDTAACVAAVVSRKERLPAWRPASSNGPLTVWSVYFVAWVHGRCDVALGGRRQLVGIVVRGA